MVRDNSTTCGAQIQDKKHKKNKNLKQGKFVQIMKANVDRTLKQIILEEDTIIIPCSRFDISHGSGDEETEMNNNKQGTSKEVVEHQVTDLINTKNLSPYKVIIYLIVMTT